MKTTQSILTIEGLSYGPQPNTTLACDVSAKLTSGRILHIVGPNGIGKSTLLRVVSGHLPPITGRVALSVNKSDIVFLPQLSNTEFHIPLTLRDVLAFSVDTFSETSALAIGFLNSHQLNRPWNSASGGERQKTLLTRAFLTPAKLLILDEPTNHLDRDSKALLQDLLVEFVRSTQNDSAIVLVSHDAISDAARTLEIVEPLDLTHHAANMRNAKTDKTPHYKAMEQAG